MKKYLILFSIAIGYWCFSQMWFPTDAKWQYKYSNFDSRTGYVELTLDGEEMKGGQLCKKIKAERHLWDLTQAPSPTWTEDVGSFYVYTANEGNELYIYQNDQFYKILDFNAEVNATWEVPNCNSGVVCTPNTGIVKVTSKGTEQINGETLKWMVLQDVSGGTRFGGKVYQKIGNVDGFFFPDYKPNSEECNIAEDAELSGDIECYKEGDYTYGLCNALSIKDIKKEDSSFKVYTNKNVVYWKDKNNSSFSISIFNSNGVLLLSTKKRGNEGISLLPYPKGVYMIKFENNKDTFTKKIIKN